MRLLKLPGLPGKDAADALGLAISHAHAGASLAALARADAAGAPRSMRSTARAEPTDTDDGDPHEPTRHHAMDRSSAAPRFRRLPGPAARRPRAGAAAVPGDLRRQRAHPQPWPSSTRWTASWCWRPTCSGARAPRVEMGYDGADTPARPSRWRMAADRPTRWPTSPPASARCVRGPKCAAAASAPRLLHGRAAGLPGRGHRRRRRRGGLLRRRHPGPARPGAADRLPDAVPLRRARRPTSR